MSSNGALTCICEVLSDLSAIHTKMICATQQHAPHLRGSVRDDDSRNAAKENECMHENNRLRLQEK